MSIENYLNHTSPNGDCLEWTRCLNSDGYPRAGRKGDSNIKVHREVFFLVNGFYPDVVRHSCDNRKCINPDHLLGGDNLDNIQDRVDRGRTNGHIPQETKGVVIDMRKHKNSYRTIADATGLTVRQIDNILYSARKAGVSFVV